MLNAILCVWNEEDVITSTIKNAFAQGCDNVYVINYDSSDRTIQKAIKAGARLAAMVKCDQFDEIKKINAINACVCNVNKHTVGDEIWWLYIDADEFPDFNNGKTIKENILELPPDVRAVSSRFFNHLPTHPPYNIEGLHPVDFMPCGAAPPDLIPEEIRKFNLLRHDKDKEPIYILGGAHEYNSHEHKVVEAEIQFILHHYNHRAPGATRKRLEALVLPDARGRRRIDWYDKRNLKAGGNRSWQHERLARLDELYADNRLGNLKAPGLEYEYRKVIRWYDPDALTLDDASLSDFDRLVWEGTHAYFLENYERAAHRFKDALEITSDERETGLLLASMARCYAILKHPRLRRDRAARPESSSGGSAGAAG